MGSEIDQLYKEAIRLKRDHGQKLFAETAFRELRLWRLAYKALMNARSNESDKALSISSRSEAPPPLARRFGHIADFCSDDQLLRKRKAVGMP